MSLLTKVRNWKLHRAWIALGSAVLGGAAVLSVVGVPKMWSAEASGWASAFWTSAAVLVSLYLASQQGRNERKAQRSRAKWVALELRQILAAWRGRVAYAHTLNGPDLYFLLNDDTLPAPTDVPKDLISLYDQLHLLGDDAAPIAEAIWIARQLHPMPICGSLRGDLEPHLAESVEFQFRAGMKSLINYLMLAENKVSSLTGISSADPKMLTFGGPYTS